MAAAGPSATTAAPRRRVPSSGLRLFGSSIARLIIAVPVMALVACSGPGAEVLEPDPTLLPTTEPLAPAAPPITSKDPSPTPVPAAVPHSLAAARSLALIDAGVQVPDYRRASFGEGWADLDRNGCSTRNDVLARDLSNVTWMQDRACTVASGILRDPYTGDEIHFQHDAIATPGNRGSQGVQIDHIVSLSAAHAGGAWMWSETERIAFSNDPDTLIAVDGPTNAAKGDRGPSRWMPEDPGYWCEYASAYTAIATTYDLAVSAGDKLMLVDVLTACR